MSNRLRRLAAKSLAVALLAATLFVADSLTSPSPAEARCVGVNHPAKSDLRWGPTYIRVTETPAAGTCNGNQTYTTTLRKESIDDYCAELWIKDGNEPWTNYLEVCLYHEEIRNWSYRDVNGNSRFYQQFCLRGRSPGVFPQLVCGWGTEIGYSVGAGSPYGTNYGF